MKAKDLLSILEENINQVPDIRKLNISITYDIYIDNKFERTEYYGVDEYEDIYDFAIRWHDRRPEYNKGWYISRFEEEYDGNIVKFGFSSSFLTTKEERYFFYLLTLPKEKIKTLQKEHYQSQEFNKIKFKPLTKKIELD